jgi:hypothetical protein
MGVLTPLYLIGLAGLSVPILLHLIRRTPRGRQVFSSLMFLTPSPPTITRRSRLDQILLLLMRLGVLALLAFAFARPFLRESSLLSISDLPRRRIALVVDTSASMRRGDLWQQAIAKAEQEMGQVTPQDDVALFTFADRLETVVGFEKDAAVSKESAVELIRPRLKDLKPTWAAGNLGQAITTIAGELDASSDVQQSLAEPQIIVISDFAKGTKIDALQSYEWPERVRLISRAVSLPQTSNASLQLLQAADDEEDAEPRVRVASAADSKTDQFFLRWSRENLPETKDGEVAIYVPPGETRVVKLPRPAGAQTYDRIVLRGDEQEFDDVHFVVPPQKQEVSVVHFGKDAADDPQGLQYYLRAATGDDPLREVKFQIVEGDDTKLLSAIPRPKLAVVTKEVPAAILPAFKEFAQQGGTLVIAPLEGDPAKTLMSFFDDLTQEEDRGGRDQGPRGKREFQLIGNVDFSHPLFASFNTPRYNDFTKIHFWKHTALGLADGATTKPVVRFDDGSPWLVEARPGKGRILGLTSSWQPDDSQLAVSTKFVPLVGNLLDLACGSAKPLAGVAVGDPVSLPADRKAPLVVNGPEGIEATVPIEAPAFTQTTAPGIYRAGLGTEELRFAVNLPPLESETSPLPLEQLEQLGVRLGTAVTQADRLSRIRQQRDTELEGRQKIWRWMIVGCLLLVMLETWWAGRAARPSQETSPGPSPGSPVEALA